MGSVSIELPWMEMAGELPSFFEMEEDAEDEARRSRRRERTTSWWTRREEEMKTLLEEELRNPPIGGEEEEEEEEDRDIVDEEEADLDTMRMYRRGWEQSFGGSYGSFQDKTSLGPMRYTDGAIPEYASCESAVQIFSVQVTELKDGLKWPLHAYGHVAIRDLLDHNRNLLFERKRDNCQILTRQDSYLLLTGPSRAAVIIDPVAFEVDLKVKGERESEDKVLSLKYFQHSTVTSYESHVPMIRRCCPSKRCMLEVKFAVLYQAVEATVVSTKVVRGSWMDHYRGQVVCRTASASEEDIVLLDSRDGSMHVNSDGAIELSRSVVSVELSGLLIFRVVASRVNDKMDVIAENSAILTPMVGGKSKSTCDLGFCEVEITVAWSLFSILEDLRRHNIL
ncbi:hypothetical protein HU200_028995 [Digitaria exilis]|uniref:DUF6598 domain-containing protein n=1 Tax=Digitaria exilis TaxID=1010633 RepID=A0A835EPK8_9POAL|nr:hypothetical protein HU200_028995 [Digitaria exilis]CAB3456780.1 unnamed protein product [Digitaria exilis]